MNNNTPKEQYEIPCMEIIVFETEDIITASGGNDKNNNGTIELPFIPVGR